MVQEQLIDYVSSQMKLGVSREAIKSALVSAGWVAGDVEDTLKKVQGPEAATAMSQSSSAVKTTSAIAQVTKGSDPQMIRVSDLVSSPFSGSAAKPMTTSTTATTAPMAKNDVAAAAKFGGTIKGNSFEAASPAHSKVSRPLILEIVGAVLILALGALAWYFYSGNAALAAKVNSLNSQSGSVTSQLSALQAQINASSSADSAEIASLTAANNDLMLNLSFYAVPLGTPTSTAMASIPVTISGSISGGGRAPYAVTTPRGAKIFIANSSNASIVSGLKSSVGQTAQLSGTYIEGSDEMTVSSIATTTVATAQ